MFPFCNLFYSHFLECFFLCFCSVHFLIHTYLCVVHYDKYVVAEDCRTPHTQDTPDHPVSDMQLEVQHNDTYMRQQELRLIFEDEPDEAHVIVDNKVFLIYGGVKAIYSSLLAIQYMQFYLFFRLSILLPHMCRCTT